MQTLLKTTMNATYTVPVATLSKGNEWMTRIKILCGLSQQLWEVWLTKHRSESPPRVGRAQQKAIIKWISQLGSTRVPVAAAALALPWKNERSGQILTVVLHKLKKPQLMGLWKEVEMFLSSRHHFYHFWRFATLKESLNLLESLFPSVKMGVIKIVPCFSKSLSYCYQNVL